MIPLFNEHIRGRVDVIAQYQVIFNSSRYSIDLGKRPGHYRHPLADQSHIMMRKSLLALIASEKNVAAVRRRFLRCARHSVFFYLVQLNRYCLFFNQKIISDRINLNKKGITRLFTI